MISQRDPFNENPVSNFLALTFLTTANACAQKPEKKTEQAAAQGCQPVSLGAPNSPDQKPAFAAQTRACGVKTAAAIEVTVVAKGLDKPWAVEPLADGSFLVTEKAGRMRIVTANGKIGEPIEGLTPVAQGGVSAESGQGGLPPISARGQGGLLDVALSPTFEKDRTIFWSFSEQREGGSGTSVARGALSAEAKSLRMCE